MGLVGANVCVVGGAGFLGSHLVNHLIKDKKCNVIVLDNLCVGRREFIHPKATFVHHDITGSEEFMRNIFAASQVRYVFNYAAWPYIPDSFDRPMQVFNVNAMGAIKVISAAQAAGCFGILQVSSAEIYGESATGHYISESHPVRPHSTYGSAKAAVDYYCQSSYMERKTPVIALRQFNCVGERETHPYVIPEILSQLYYKEGHGQRDGMYYKIRLGNNSERDFLYAGDAVAIAADLLDKSVESGKFGRVYNLGSESSIRIYDLAIRIGELTKRSVAIEVDDARKRPWEIWSLKSRNDEIYSMTEVRPSVSLNEALIRTIDDFQKHGHKWCWQ